VQIDIVRISYLYHEIFHFIAAFVINQNNDVISKSWHLERLHLRKRNARMSHNRCKPLAAVNKVMKLRVLHAYKFETFFSNWRTMCCSARRLLLHGQENNDSRLQWPSSLRHRLSSPPRRLGSWVSIPPEALMSVCVYALLCVGRGLATGWSPLQGVVPAVYKIKSKESSPSA
jgi:hypothetical protein